MRYAPGILYALHAATGRTLTRRIRQVKTHGDTDYFMTLAL
jgi:hypothetical protein